MMKFGEINGEIVNAVTLKSATVEVVILSFGGIIQSLKTVDKDGNWDDIVTGFDTIKEYPEKSQFFGCLVGRYANRIGGGAFEIKSKKYNLFKNNGGQPFQNSLHGGKKGFDKVNWGMTEIQNGVKLDYTSIDGEEGYPGNLKVTVYYTLVNGEFSIRYVAETDAETVVNLTNHTYFNLDGHKNWTNLENHQVTLFADAYVPVNDVAIPIGGTKSVAETSFDCRQGKNLTEANLKAVEGQNGFDHNFCLKTSNSRDMVKMAKMTSKKTGRVMELSGNQPGVQFYTGNFVRGQEGKSGVKYLKQSAFCLETQHFPDTPNQPEFPTATITPAESYDYTATFSFSVAE